MNLIFHSTLVLAYMAQIYAHPLSNDAMPYTPASKIEARAFPELMSCYSACALGEATCKGICEDRYYDNTLVSIYALFIISAKKFCRQRLLFV